MKYLLEIYRNENKIDEKYAYTLNELREWYEHLYADDDVIYYLYEIRATGNYFKGVD